MILSYIGAFLAVGSIAIGAIVVAVVVSRHNTKMRFQRQHGLGPSLIERGERQLLQIKEPPRKRVDLPIKE